MTICTTCTTCSNRQFASTDALFQHLRSSKKRHFFCDPCKIPFADEAVLNAHKEAVHSSIFCGICKLFFPNEEGLQVHFRDSSTHTACNLCGAGFIDINACKSHQRQHHGQTRKRRRRGCKSPTSSSDGVHTRSSSASSVPSLFRRKSSTPESSVHTPVTVHTPLDEPDEEGMFPEEEEDVEATPQAVPRQYISPLRSTSPEQIAVPVPVRQQSIVPLFHPEAKRRNSSSPEHSPVEPQPQAVFSPSWRAGSSQVQPIPPSPFGIPAKPRLRPLVKGYNDVEHSPLEPQLMSRFNDPSTPLLEAEMPLPPREGGPGDMDEEDDDWETRPVIPAIIADDESGREVIKAAEEHLSETGDPSEYVNPYIDEEEMKTILLNINTSEITNPASGPPPESEPIVSPVVAPSRQFNMTLTMIREASNVPLPSDAESDDGPEPMSTASEFANAFAHASDHSPMPSLYSLPHLEDAYDGGDDFSDYAGSSAGPSPSPLDRTFLSSFARQLCQSRSEDSTGTHLLEPFSDYGSSRGSSPVEQSHSRHSSSGAITTKPNIRDDDEVGHGSRIDHDDIPQEVDHVSSVFGHSDEGERWEHDSHGILGLVYNNHDQEDSVRAPSSTEGLLAMEPSPWEDQVSGNARGKERSSSSSERARGRNDSPESSRRNPLINSRVEDLNYRSDGEPSQSNTGTASGRTSRHSRSSSRSFNHSVDNETRVTTPISPKDEGPLLGDMSLQNPRGTRFHCRLCMLEPCEDATATFCGHIFCNACIVEEVMETSRCPVCTAPTLLYCLFRLDLHA
ncbi:hypothetical protein SCHPADRAFT_944845 [Schizopora paradoxa]|uniref:RING-type domain-containing protein n=1 Tax=Schizopora paradoxa TaxID=27342 RepID=A0A0H2R9A9_9AGAM|nr:hypothetical protein SCHPADRAFT_944845 [Schizopora paradoxa]